MRTVLTLAAAAAALVMPALLRADEATLRDGRRVPGRLTWDGARLQFIPTGKGPALAPEQFEHVRLAAEFSPFRAGVVHQVHLAGDQRLTGELLLLDAQGLQLRTPWKERLTVPRPALDGVAQLDDSLVLVDEDFENDLKRWKKEGLPPLTQKQRTSGQNALLLAAPGQAVTYTLTAPLQAGRLSVNFQVPAEVSGARWDVEAAFRSKAGPQRVRVTVADDASVYAVAAPSPRDEGVSVPRRPGWHRLAIEFTATSLLVTVDDALLWYSRQQGPGKGLDEVRLSCTQAPAKTDLRGAVAFDELTLSRTVAVLRRPAAASGQDELWLAAGDQLIGRLARADRQGIAFDAGAVRRTWSWAGVRGVFPKRPPGPTFDLDGEHVRLALHPAAGSEPDTIEGMVRGLDEQRLLLRHAALGDLEIPRGRVQRLRPRFFGRSRGLDSGVRHLGQRGNLVPGVFPARAEGPAVEYLVPFDEPRPARLVLTVQHLADNGTKTEVIVNGTRVDDLNRHAGASLGEPRRVIVPLPSKAFRTGVNAVQFRQVAPQGGRPGSTVVSDVVLEVPR